MSPSRSRVVPPPPRRGCSPSARRPSRVWCPRTSAGSSRPRRRLAAIAAARCADFLPVRPVPREAAPDGRVSSPPIPRYRRLLRLARHPPGSRDHPDDVRGHRTRVASHGAAGRCIAVLEAAYPPALAQDWDAVGLVAGDPVALVSRGPVRRRPRRRGRRRGRCMGRRPPRDPPPLAARRVHSIGGGHLKGACCTGWCSAGSGSTPPTRTPTPRPGESRTRSRPCSGSGSRRRRSRPASEALDKHVSSSRSERRAAWSTRSRRSVPARSGSTARCAWTSTGEGTFTAVGPARTPRSDPVGVAVARGRGTCRDGRASTVRRGGSSPPCGPRTRTRSPRSTCWSSRRGRGRRGIGRIGRLGRCRRPCASSRPSSRGPPATTGASRFAGDPDGRVERVAVVGGSGDSLSAPSAGSGVDAYVTADLRHHPASEHVLAGGGVDRPAPALVDLAHGPRVALARRARRGPARRAGGRRVPVTTRRTYPWTIGRTQEAGKTRRPAPAASPRRGRRRAARRPTAAGSPSLSGTPRWPPPRPRSSQVPKERSSRPRRAGDLDRDIRRLERDVEAAPHATDRDRGSSPVPRRSRQAGQRPAAPALRQAPGPTAAVLRGRAAGGHGAARGGRHGRRARAAGPRRGRARAGCGRGASRHGPARHRLGRGRPPPRARAGRRDAARGPARGVRAPPARAAAPGRRCCASGGAGRAAWSWTAPRWRPSGRRRRTRWRTARSAGRCWSGRRSRGCERLLGASRIGRRAVDAPVRCRPGRAGDRGPGHGGSVAERRHGGAPARGGATTAGRVRGLDRSDRHADAVAAAAARASTAVGRTPLLGPGRPRADAAGATTRPRGAAPAWRGRGHVRLAPDGVPP